MSRASFIHSACSISLLIAALLLCGCEGRDSPSEQIGEQPSTPSGGESVRDSRAQPDVDESRETAARIARLSVEIDAAMAHRTELQQQREAIHARLVTHEEQGMAMLDSLESEMQQRASQGRDDAAFKAEALSKLEAALQRDDALTTSLRDIDASIAETNVVIERLSAEREELQESQPSNMAASQQ